MNPKNTVFISSTDEPSGANLAVIFVTPSRASRVLNPKVFCASAAIFCDSAKSALFFVNNDNLKFNLSKFAAVVIAFFANKVTPIPPIAVLKPPMTFVVRLFYFVLPVMLLLHWWHLQLVLHLPVPRIKKAFIIYYLELCFCRCMALFSCSCLFS